MLLSLICIFIVIQIYHFHFSNNICILAEKDLYIRQCSAKMTCIVVLIGIPGSGKTELCRRLSEKLKSEKSSCIHVCYDQLISLEKQKNIIQEQGSWKEERGKIVRAVDSLLSDAEVEKSNDNEFFRVLKKEYRSGLEKHTLLIDDNNYLQSMRHEYYQLCRKHQIGFAQLFMSCETETATKFNVSREADQQVPENVIKTMAAKLEIPNPLKNKWEAFSFTITNSPSVKTEDHLEMIEAVIEAAASHPVLAAEPEVSEEERERDRVSCTASLVHQADKLLRSLVNKRMLSLKKSGLSKEEMNAASKKIYSVKIEILEDLKTGFTKLDRLVINSVQNRDPDGVLKLENELESIFNSKIKS